MRAQAAERLSWWVDPLQAEFVLALASGRYDALSVRYLTIDDDLEALLARIDAVKRDDLLMLGLRQ